MTKRAIPQGISLYPDEWAQLDQTAADLEMNRSQVLRKILREWKDQQIILSAVRAYMANVIKERELVRLITEASESGDGPD